MDDLLAALTKHWGYDSFRPYQREAMECALQGRDSLVVLPTGGGKSLCYQVPAVCRDTTAIVVSPLIALMKDQVDDLTSCGVEAAQLNSSLGTAESRRVMDRLRSGTLKLLYMAPERLVMEGTLQMLARLRPSFVAVDEAHCISAWGHDFRPEYRGLKVLREALPGISLHAFTATATERVRLDIVSQLGLDQPKVLVGPFFRSNLTYQVVHRQDAHRQIREVIGRYPGESGIVYCISRADVERTAAALVKGGISALPYHAGLDDSVRRANQDAFLQDRAQVMVATVAFGMGIDKPDVRFVVHGGAPKSLEAYQQESGRAGRDGQPADCVLLYSGGDFAVWRKMLAGGDPQGAAGVAASLDAMHGYCTRMLCRHRTLVRYFGQDLPVGSCGSCDVCSGDVEQVPDALTVGQKILSCVVRLQQSFGADYTTKVLVGSTDDVILGKRHHELSTYGLLKQPGKAAVRDWIEQLVGQGYMVRHGEYNVLRVTPAGGRLLKGEVTPVLGKPRPPAAKKRSTKRGAGAAPDSLQAVDTALFEALRALRRKRAEAAGVPAYVVFPDSTLRELARRRPSTLSQMREVPGIGDRKLADYGQAFLEVLNSYDS